MQFEFTTASRIIFGAGRLNTVGDLVSELGRNALIVSGCPKQISDRLVNLLEPKRIICTFKKISPEPTVDSISELVNLCQQSKCDVVIGIGGGSAIDSAKATAALYTNPGNVTDYLEVIGLNKPLRNPALPLIAIPTTSGTGSEVTRNAVLGSRDDQIKVSLRSQFLLPRIALIDPELVLSLPPFTTAITGMDALTQLIEPFTCNTPNPLTDALCSEGISRVAHSIYQAYDHGDDLDARQDMALASLFSGLCLANARLGAVHGLAGPLGGELTAPHGAICACLLPRVMEANLDAARNLDIDHPTVTRYRIIAEQLCKTSAATAEAGIAWVRDFCRRAKIPQLSAYGLSDALFDKIVAKAVNTSSMKGNSVTLSQGELRNILQKCL